MGKSIIKDLLRDNNFRYFFRIFKRITKVGLGSVINEFIKYYKKYSQFPQLIDNQRPDFKYKLFVIYNYFKIVALHPEIENNDLMGYLPTRLQKYFIYKFDPVEKRILTFDKILFYKILDSLKLPYPKVIFYLKDKKKLNISGEDFFTKDFEIPPKFFVKPIRDNGGKNAGIYSKEMLGIISGELLAQELAKNHSSLIELAGDFAFNTVRIVSFLDKNGNVNLLSAILRLSNGKQVDNWGKGSINVEVNIETGKLGKYGVTKYFERFEKHPKGLFKFENFEIPYWKELLDVVNKGSRGLNYLRLIAWDIGIDPHGPLIVEANAGCDLFHAQLFKPYGDTILIKDLINA